MLHLRDKHINTHKFRKLNFFQYHHCFLQCYGLNRSFIYVRKHSSRELQLCHHTIIQNSFEYFFLYVYVCAINVYALFISTPDIELGCHCSGTSIASSDRVSHRLGWLASCQKAPHCDYKHTMHGFWVLGIKPRSSCTWSDGLHLSHLRF